MAIVAKNRPMSSLYQQVIEAMRLLEAHPRQWGPKKSTVVFVDGNQKSCYNITTVWMVLKTLVNNEDRLPILNW